MTKQKLLILVAIILLSVFYSGCSENAIGFYVDTPQTLKRIKLASFYGPEAKQNCELYRRFFASMCDTKSQLFITCYDLSDKRYQASKCY